MQIVTFNIRCDYGQDGNNNFVYRKDLITKKIKEEQPDILCFQEVLPHVAEWLKTSLTEYYVIGCGRDSKLENEQTCIAYRRDLYNMVKMEVFWLSDTPEIPGSRFINQSECPRTCTVLYLQEIRTAKVFRVYNTHLDHICSDARVQGLSLIMDRISKANYLGDIPFILAGDFNAFPDSEELALLANNESFYDCTKKLEGTFHDYGRIEEEKIDYIIAHKAFTCKAAVRWMDCTEGVYLSDHYPVSVVLSQDEVV